ncbi:hypothetical protein GUITHDRAFT_149083 [Guillardia theta CCMP2712]|uniref:Uncharacterized protein n=1 Tax=Guillardia theta (strain CCMP2712) TaxID=905079 RepID=L1I6V1_GUITC|nr:hypothetical protein GUITHDRAFT_149083 [Guillardia theta CCMP2712]EKX31777.1 hypothetical protein GUITHDRAFT_149083 [Guillardia theta CCMP2712]|eukprot:XP_005818757.1 hypothetical protein GUITHDRAFT_149083 [Guillardia theta CCMP2712]
MLAHLIVKPYDPSMDYASVCNDLFGDNKCLVMLEKKGGDHCHIQGELKAPKTEEQWRNYIGDLAMEHYRRKQDPKSRPVKRRKLEADEVGFQYMAKELPTSVVIYKQGFSDEDLQELYEKSNEHRDELQSKPGEYIAEKIGGDTESWTPGELHKRVCYYAFQYYLAEGKMRPPNIKILCEH